MKFLIDGQLEEVCFHPPPGIMLPAFFWCFRMTQKWNQQVTENKLKGNCFFGQFKALKYVFRHIFQKKTKLVRMLIYTSIPIDFDPLNPMEPSI